MLERAVRWRIAAVAAVCALAGCGKNFGIQVDVERGCLPDPVAASITVEVLPGGLTRSEVIPDPAAFFASDHRVTVVPPPGTTSVEVTVSARGGDGEIARAGVTVAVGGSQLAQATITLGECRFTDFAAPPVPDGSLGDLAVPDLEPADAPFDLAVPGPDLVLLGCSDETCPSGQVCDRKGGKCVACLADRHCPYGTICSPSHACVPGCKVTHGCGDGGSCDPDAGVCRTCGSDHDCGGNTPRCDAVTGSCAACLPGGAECAGVCQRVDGRYQCLPSCVISADCPDGLSCCHHACVDTTSDVANCGVCDTACVVAHGVPQCTRYCGVLLCDAGWGDCDQVVVNGCEANLRLDVKNCGACGHACGPEAPVCLDGICGGKPGDCPIGLVRCNGQCVDLATDLNDCGACNVACKGGGHLNPTCVAGRCGVACVAPWLTCTMNQPCAVNSWIDGANCGACGSPCPGGQLCFAGHCFMPTDDGGPPQPVSDGGGQGGVDAGCAFKVPPACQAGTDPETNAPWVVCSSSCLGAWISTTGNGGSYHPLQICTTLGYKSVFGPGANCANVCGSCGETPGSCNAPHSFPASPLAPCGNDANGTIYCGPLSWGCSP